MLKSLFVVGVGVGISILGAQAEPTFQLDPTNNRVVSISNLYADPTCTPRQFRGTVVERQFREDRVTVSGFVLKHPYGSRDFIYVDTHFKGLTLNASGWIIRGLQTLLAEGRVVDVVVKSCGDADNLDAVREVPP